jgi:hypothetical protein
MIDELGQTILTWLSFRVITTHPFIRVEPPFLVRRSVWRFNGSNREKPERRQGFETNRELLHLDRAGRTIKKVGIELALSRYTGIIAFF